MYKSSKIKYTVQSLRNYEASCRHITEMQPIHLLPNSELRGSEYHLDHIFPISMGYELDIPYFIMADIDNLQLIKKGENLGKNDRVTPASIETLKWLVKKFGMSDEVVKKAIGYTFKGKNREIWGKVKSIRIEKGIGPSMLCKNISLELDDYYRIERGDIECTLSTFITIIEGLDIEMVIQAKEND